MLKSTYLQQCAHNLHERNQISVALQERCSKARRMYLKQRMAFLNKEKQFFLNIKNEFIIFKSDCWSL